MTKNTSSIDIHIGKSIRQARVDVNANQEQLASLLGISTMQMHKYETGKNRVSAARLYEIAVFTGKPVGWFYPCLHG